MKKLIYKFGSLILIGLASCSVENPFQGPQTSGSGELSKYAMDFDVSILNNTRASSDDIIDDFSIVIKKVGSVQDVAYSSLYKNMPDVVSLEAGSYIAYATYGENQDAAFEKPYFLGQSKQFEIEANKITTDIGTIQCKLENVKVTIDFHSSLYSQMDDEAYVEVYVNPASSLKFYKNEKRAGYFKHSDVCTLTATFHGNIDGVDLNEVKTLSDINKGNHYSLTFSKHNYSADNENGEILPDITVAASVTIVNVNENITIADDEILNDSERPKEEDPTEDPGKDPSDPDDPDDPDDPSDPENPDEIVYPDGPQAKLDDICTVKLGEDEVNYIDGDTKVILNIHSNAGLDTFYVMAESRTLKLEQLGAEDGKLDMIEPNAMETTLHQLGLMDDDVHSYKGYKDVKFDISGFMDLLMLLGEDSHLFIIHLGDADGEDTVYLNLTYKK